MSDQNNAVAAPDPLLRTLKELLAGCYILRDQPGITRENAEFITTHLIKTLQDAISRLEGKENGGA